MPDLKDNSTIISQASTSTLMTGSMGISQTNTGIPMSGTGIGPGMIAQASAKPCMTISSNGGISSTGVSSVSVLEPISSRLTAIEERLAIITPDLHKLEKYAALKQAYDHYKVLENLCKEDK